MLALGEAGGEVDRGRRLSGAALLVEDRDPPRALRAERLVAEPGLAALERAEVTLAGRRRSPRSETRRRAGTPARTRCTSSPCPYRSGIDGSGQLFGCMGYSGHVIAIATARSWSRRRRDAGRGRARRRLAATRAARSRSCSRTGDSIAAMLARELAARGSHGAVGRLLDGRGDRRAAIAATARGRRDRASTATGCASGIGVAPELSKSRARAQPRCGRARGDGARHHAGRARSRSATSRSRSSTARAATRRRSASARRRPRRRSASSVAAAATELASPRRAFVWANGEAMRRRRASSSLLELRALPFEVVTSCAPGADRRAHRRHRGVGPR